MAKAKKETESPKLGREIAAVFGIFLAVFLFICLASFSLPESSADFSGLSSRNWGGSVGHVLAMGLMGFLGISSFWLVVLLLIFSIQFFSGSNSIDRIPYVMAGCSGILIASSGFTAAMHPESIRLIRHTFPSGGYLGNLLEVFFGKFFGGYLFL